MDFGNCSCVIWFLGFLSCCRGMHYYLCCILYSKIVVQQSPLKIGNYTIPVGAAVAIDGKSPSLESEEFNKSPYSYDKFDPSRFVNNQYSEYVSICTIKL